jgi:TPP-dependent pyruvate/acetoin dehydrogenase alpha subunit
MHLYHAATRFYGGNAIVGGGLPLAVGLALADRMRDLPVVTCCIFGDGAVAEGEFHECMNLAALWKLPVLFVCENNFYAMGSALSLTESVTDLSRKADAYNVPHRAVDGMDVLAVERAAREAAHSVRGGSGPFFLECRTYRFRAHSMFDAELYRDKHEVEEWKKRDPISTLAHSLRGRDVLGDSALRDLRQAVDDEIRRAVEFAESGTLEPVEDLARFVYTERSR